MVDNGREAKVVRKKICHFIWTGCFAAKNEINNKEFENDLAKRRVRLKNVFVFFPTSLFRSNFKGFPSDVKAF